MQGVFIRLLFSQYTCFNIYIPEQYTTWACVTTFLCVCTSSTHFQGKRSSLSWNFAAGVCSILLMLQQISGSKPRLIGNLDSIKILSYFSARKVKGQVLTGSEHFPSLQNNLYPCNLSSRDFHWVTMLIVVISVCIFSVTKDIFLSNVC